MNGIGKTTIAEEVYSKLCSEYESCYFKADVREECRRHGIMYLKKELYSTLLKQQDLNIDIPHGLPYFVVRMLHRMKVLVVLDDVDDYLQQLETLIGSTLDNWFGKGSRIIITSGDRQVLAGRVDDIYEVKPLEFNDSLRLFNLNAFQQNQTNQKEYKELSKMMVEYAAGNPLVLKVLGSLLRGKDKERWEDYLGRFRKNIPIKIVHQIFRSSYNDLDCHEKKIFLDIACFFNGLRLKVNYIQLLVARVELESLEHKALITISSDNVVSMHNIIQQTALEIVLDESNYNRGKQSRLLNSDDISNVLKNNEVKA
jgi:ribosomal protein L21E